MSTCVQQKPETPCSSSELLDYLFALNGRQVDAYKLLCGGIARSSYAITYCGCDEFDMFVSIADEWVTMERNDFLKFHGDGERIWHIWE